MKVYENISLKPYNTFGIDVKARRLMLLEPGDDVPPAEGNVLLLGGGSNMVFTKDYDGTVITLANQKLSTVNSPLSTVTVWGGMVMDDFIQWAITNGLYGAENLSAIPGTVGASAVQNVGAYGVEAKDIIDHVEAYDMQERRHVVFSNAECRFGYRQSFFKWVTFRLSATFVPNLSYKALENVPHVTASQLREAITDIRWGKLPRPEEHGSAGSFFKNPVVDATTYRHLKAEYPDMPDAHQSADGYKLSAGWLIDKAGWKGRTLGNAGVWPKNALVLYNTGGCTGDEVVALSTAIQDDIKQKFNIILTPEAIII